MRGVLIAGAMALVLAACGAAPPQIMDRQDYLAEATRIYQHESKERVLEAAEAIIRTSDPQNVDMRYTDDGFTAIRRYFIYAVIAAARGQEKWELHTEERPNAVEASLSISDEGTSASGYSAEHYDMSMNSIPLYRLFWKRMDYMLGRTADWPSCDEEKKLLEAQGTNAVSALGGLCGITSAERDAVPQPLPAQPFTAAEKNASASEKARAAIMNRPGM
jgi:hypothetical protein